LEFDRTPLQAGSNERSGDAGGALGGFGSQHLSLDGKAQLARRLAMAFTQQDIDAAIDAAAARHHVDPSLVRSVVKVESNFNPNAVSRKGAMGLMQLMPSTARSLNVSNPFDPAQNVDAGVRHLRKLLDSYGGNVRLSLAAYNAGSGAVARSAGVPHFRETQDYVRRITNLYHGGGEPGPHIYRQRHGVTSRCGWSAMPGRAVHQQHGMKRRRMGAGSLAKF
jgi:hypothetical protein